MSRKMMWTMVIAAVVVGCVDCYGICIRQKECRTARGAERHWQDCFETAQPLHIEIGMGKGRFIMDMAALHPDINYIGIERYSSVLLRALQKMEQNPLPNIKFICMDAADVAEVFAKDEVTVFT